MRAFSTTRWLALAAVVACASAGCNGRPAPPAQLTAPAAVPDAEAVELGPGVWRGVCFAHSWEWMGLKGYGSDSSGEALDHLRSLGVDWISVTPFGFMGSVEDDEVRGEHTGSGPPGAESRERIAAVAEQARTRGLKVMLKPHIWIRGGKWRGRIRPPDWNSWWDSYARWITYYATVAADLGLEALVIGLELDSAVRAHPERLIALAGEVRRIYGGHITYAANWNESVPTTVWRELDSVGVQFYPPLASTRGAFDEREVHERLRAQLDRWGGIAAEVARPLVITEVGYRSADTAASHPNAWPEKSEADEDCPRQAAAYRAFFSEVARTPQVRGVFLWKYFTNPDTDEEGPTGFSPLGKPAEDVIRVAY